MMKTDYEMNVVISEINKETNINIKQIEIALDSYYRNAVDCIKAGEPRIKFDYLGSLRKKEEFIFNDTKSDSIRE